MSFIDKFWWILQNRGSKEAFSSGISFIKKQVVPLSVELQIRKQIFKSRHGRPIPDPLRLYWLSPDDIEYGIPDQVFPRSPPISGVIGGDWDKNKIGFSQTSIYRMFVERFEDNLEWEETRRYRWVKKKISEGERFTTFSMWDQELDDYKEYLSYMDNLYMNIKLCGYKIQEELNHDNCRRWEANRRHPSLNEITIDLGRKGEPILTHGNHRLAIVKILNVEKIPVRVRIRHSQWHRKKKRVIDRSKKLGEEVPANHFDIKDLL